MADLNAVLTKLEAVTLKIAAGAGGDIPEGEMSPAVQAYYDFYSASVQPFVDACNKIEGTKKLGTWTETAMKHIGKALQATQDCAKPENAAFLKFLDPVVKIINESGNPDNRSESFAQEKSFNELIQSCSWVMMDGGKAFIIGQLEAADFYLNKVLVAAKDKEDPDKTSMRDYVKLAKGMLNALAEYSHSFHKTGLTWKFKGADINTWKPGQAAASSKSSEAKSPEDRIASCCQKLEAYAATLGGGEDAEGTPIKVSEYNEFYSTHVQAFVDAANKIEATKKIGAWAETAFKHLGTLIQAAHDCKKPSDTEFVAFLGPIVKVVEASGNPDKRADSFNQEKAFAEAIQAMNWVMMGGAAGLPRPFIQSQLDGADFYLIKVLTAAKDKADPEKTDMRDYVKYIKAMLTELMGYVQKNYKTGLEWNAKGKSITEVKVAASAAPAAEVKKAAPKKKAFAFKPRAAAPKVGKIDTSREDKIFVDNFGRDQKEPVIVKIPKTDKPKTGVFVGGCQGCVIKIEGKAKNITISGCKDAGIVFDDCVTTVEIINSQKCQVQALEAAGTFTMDKCDRVKVYLANNSYEAGCLVMTAMCSASNIYYPSPDGEDQLEYGVPEQMISTFELGKDPTTEVVIPDAE